MRPVVFIGMETSGALRLRFQERSIFTVSCDKLPADDGAGYDEGGLGGHIQGDVFETLDYLSVRNRWPQLGIFHPTCTYLTNSAAWAYNDPDFVRYPGVGYHQKVKPGTLTGWVRRIARKSALDDARKIMGLRMIKIVENPVGAISTAILKPTQITQPYEHGDDASKGTCLWMLDDDGNEIPELRIPIDPAKRVPGRMVPCHKSGVSNERDPEYVTYVERWSNQTDSGQNKLTPGADRWKDRSRTYPGIADAMVEHCVRFLGLSA